jgi:hypothetical protein
VLVADQSGLHVAWVELAGLLVDADEASSSKGAKVVDTNTSTLPDVLWGTLLVGEEGVVAGVRRIVNSVAPP